MQLAEVKAEREQLLTHKEALSRLKYEYEWNPSSEGRRQLEASRQEAEAGITAV